MGFNFKDLRISNKKLKTQIFKFEKLFFILKSSLKDLNVYFNDLLGWFNGHKSGVLIIKMTKGFIIQTHHNLFIKKNKRGINLLSCLLII